MPLHQLKSTMVFQKVKWVQFMGYFNIMVEIACGAFNSNLIHHSIKIQTLQYFDHECSQSHPYHAWAMTVLIGRSIAGARDYQVILPLRLLLTCPSGFIYLPLRLLSTCLSGYYSPLIFLHSNNSLGSYVCSTTQARCVTYT